MKKLLVLFVLLAIPISAQFLYNFGPDSPNVLKKTTGFGGSLACEINITCDNGFLPVSDGVFWFNGCTAFFLANTSGDGRLLFMTVNHVFPSNVAIGGTTTIAIKFNYQSSSCSNPIIEPSDGVFSLNLTVRLLVRTSYDQVLCEIVDDGSLPPMNITLLGWDTRYTRTSSIEMAFMGHPQADIKKIAYPTVTGSNSWNTWTKVIKGNGTVEVGYSGAPLLGKDDDGIRVYGLASAGSVYGCNSDVQSYITAKNIGADWNLLAPYLDPLNSNALFCSGEPAALPVELIFFSAFVDENFVELNWKTATEVNNYGFEVERKTLDSGWETIGFVEGHGNSNSPKEYLFFDADVTNGVYSYRLKQIDNNGKFEYSSILEVIIKIPINFVFSQNYPNPFNPETVISYQLPIDDFVNLKIYDIVGREVSELVNEEKKAGIYQIRFDGSNLSSGVYFYRITTGDFSKIKKMILIK
ncbi:MAG: hypothetical protein UR25_C0005G0035 [Candidatus Nomurabacteria bacterium GW2011_GWE1_32_28]|uniref:Secretion system C-terminal sorting domain-containing protein n=1 Tax=Candidatus Nomurabacteria bacterium GW2011_GWF1_31_48 TaxID=1618767 RepID=A0A0G0BG33_9BACT|nr:MAG: hypothetical protein UR10_C0003G0233 [Candidatus Nomurabacteria bacterium GW2011_GWF2_30_133]KKP28452.1 MAG: hypothetical protein UR18_C0004G0034 [Candidatus Nomurabacteria bacterium GW2011_GWE2_31_40]KKP30032.1 MAG: hypothetical protein UR19_C0005G0034 [Candidatus Nomurabacteria bacterium GW2011_GWF1_31_48]KKP34551.1 MAG: hypothetical protein UR25_C0005G0035 [Candidatus Nomurabacteria bacterium GW2011_GWE1_32_28]HAS81051.1 hypothetical protein [Candidatus Nomurabacteria bacterium]